MLADLLDEHGILQIALDEPRLGAPLASLLEEVCEVGVSTVGEGDAGRAGLLGEQRDVAAEPVQSPDVGEGPPGRMLGDPAAPAFVRRLEGRAAPVGRSAEASGGEPAARGQWQGHWARL